MIFNLGRFEVLLILVVAFVVLGIPLISWILARREAKKR